MAHDHSAPAHRAGDDRCRLIWMLAIRLVLRIARLVAARRSSRLLVAGGICALLAVTGWIQLSRQQERARTGEFADRAERMRANTVEAVDFFKQIVARGREPTQDELRAWHDRNARVDAEATEAALRLRAPKRARALRWLRTQQALRSARVSARVIAASRILFDYCTERQQFIGEAVRWLAPSERLAALNPCFDQQSRNSDAGQDRIAEAIGRLEVEEATAWAKLLESAPEIRR